MNSQQKAKFQKLYYTKEPSCLELLNQFKNQEFKFNTLVDKIIAQVNSLPVEHFENRVSRIQGTRTNNTSPTTKNGKQSSSYHNQQRKESLSHHEESEENEEQEGSFLYWEVNDETGITDQDQVSQFESPKKNLNRRPKITNDDFQLNNGNFGKNKKNANRIRSNSENTENQLNSLYNSTRRIANKSNQSPSDFHHSGVFKEKSIPIVNSSRDNNVKLDRVYPQQLQDVSNYSEYPPNVSTPCFFNQKKSAKYSISSKNRLIGDTMGKNDKISFNFNRNMVEFAFTQSKVPKTIIDLCSGFIGNEWTSQVIVCPQYSY